jgi:hypothetical protein
MQFTRSFLAALLFVPSLLLADPKTVTFAGELHGFSYSDAGNYDNWFTGYEDVHAGDPYQLKLVFNDAALISPGIGAAAYLPGALIGFELSLDGIVRMTASSLNVQAHAVNNSSGKDTFTINLPAVAVPVLGLDPDWWPKGNAFLNLQFQDSTMSAMTAGQPIDFAPFFADNTGSLAISVGFSTGNPYSGYGPRMTATIQSGALVSDAVPPTQTPSVPDGASTLALALVAGVALVSVRRRAIA